MNDGSVVIAYHGCDALVRDDLVTRRLRTLKQSDNSYDWLEPGVYFYEGDSSWRCAIWPAWSGGSYPATAG